MSIFRPFSFGILLHACVSTVAMAQSDPSASAGTDGEIIVTAQKRSERLQDVPISVSALTGAALQQQRITQTDELATKIPNLQLTSTVGDNTPIFALRGVSMSDYSLNQASPVATYYDEVYKGNFAFLGVAMFDLERVEVLRGPQGTLYGKNTTGGAVNLISRAPRLDRTDGYLNVGYGNYDRRDVNGAANLPLNSTLAARIAFTWSKADGWLKNVLPGKPDLASVSEYGVRGSLLFEPRDGLSFTLRASTSYQNPRNFGIYAQPEALLRPGLKRREIQSNVTDRRRARTYALALTGNVEISDGLDLISVTSWDRGRLSVYEDTDGTASQLLEIPTLDRATQFAQDVRLVSKLDGPFNIIAGAYYNREKVYNRTRFEVGKDIDVDANGTIDANDCLAGFPLACLFQNSFHQLKKSVALYADMTFKITDAATVRGGLRYTRDTGRQTDFRSDALAVDQSLIAVLISASSLRYRTGNLSGKIGIDYKLPAIGLVYANFSRGYRANSFNAQAFFDPSELSVSKPEKVDAFEIGTKSQFLDRAITLNMAAFYYRYSNQQFINVDPVTAAQTLLNIPRSQIYGGEIELSARPSDLLTLRAGLGLLHTEIRKGTVSGVDVRGNHLSNAPAMTFSGGVEARLMDNASGRITLTADISHQSSQYFEVININRLRQRGYNLLSGSLGWRSSDDRFSLSIWGKNLTNKFYFTSRVDLLAGFGFDYNHVGTPRTYGITMGVKY